MKTSNCSATYQPVSELEIENDGHIISIITYICILNHSGSPHLIEERKLICTQKMLAFFGFI
jgi:hypothetical protein